MIIKNIFRAVFALLLIHSSALYCEDAKIESIESINDTFSILAEYKDSGRILELKLVQLEEINKERKKHNKERVEFDILASRVANLHCRNGALGGYSGHYDENGYLPFIRYSLFGGSDHVSENAASLINWSVLKGKKPDEDYLNMFLSDMQDTTETMQMFLKGFMKEGPGGGHHDNVIDPAHNYVGIGYFDTSYIRGDSVVRTIRYAEEFLDRYAVFNETNRFLQRGDDIEISGVLKNDTLGISMLSIDYFPFPKKMNRKAINKKHSYNDYSSKQHLLLPPWELKGMLYGDSFLFKSKVKKKGLYYVKILADKKKKIPYEILSGKKKISYSSKNAVPISGIVIWVE